MWCGKFPGRLARLPVGNSQRFAGVGKEIRVPVEQESSSESVRKEFPHIYGSAHGESSSHGRQEALKRSTATVGGNHGSFHKRLDNFGQNTPRPDFNK